jgi:ribose transport system substrate-binding protein
MRRTIIALLAVLLIGSSFTVAPAAQKEVTVCFVTFSLQVAFFHTSVDGGQREAQAQGAKMIVQDPQADTQKQVTQIEDCVARGANAIVVDAIESKAVLGPIAEAKKKGVVVVAVDTFLDSPDVTSNVGVSNFDAAREYGHFIAAYILGKYNGKADVGIVLASTEVQLARRDGFLAAMKSLGSSVRVVGTADGRNILERATAVSEDLLSGNPSITVIYATGEPQLLGALASAASQKRSNIAFFGWDKVPDPFIKPIQQGRLVAVTNQQPELQGQLGVRYAVMAARGEKVPSRVNTPVAIITKLNLSEWMK